MLRKKRGQSLIEYIILLASVIVLLLVFSKKGGYFQNAMNNTIKITGNHMLNIAEQIFY